MAVTFEPFIVESSNRLQNSRLDLSIQKKMSTAHIASYKYEKILIKAWGEQGVQGR